MYEQNLKEELFACFKYVGIPLDVVDKMPIRDRKYYITKYNEYMEMRLNAIEGNASSSSMMNISDATDMSQGYIAAGE